VTNSYFRTFFWTAAQSLLYQQDAFWRLLFTFHISFFYYCVGLRVYGDAFCRSALTIDKYNWLNEYDWNLAWITHLGSSPHTVPAPSGFFFHVARNFWPPSHPQQSLNVSLYVILFTYWSTLVNKLNVHALQKCLTTFTCASYSNLLIYEPICDGGLGESPSAFWTRHRDSCSIRPTMSVR